MFSRAPRQKVNAVATLGASSVLHIEHAPPPASGEAEREAENWTRELFRRQRKGFCSFVRRHEGEAHLTCKHLLADTEGQ